MLIDSYILIYTLNQASPKQQAAQAFLQSQDQLIFAQQNIFETLHILTHPRYPNPFLPEEALEAVTLITDQSTIIYPSAETADIACELVKKYQVTGAEVFDAYLVATALSNDIRHIASDNLRHLNKYQEVRMFNPLLEWDT